MLTIQNITEENWRYSLTVADEQRCYVANTATILARAYAFRDKNSYACFFCKNNQPIGMALYYDCPKYNAYDISQFFIDERFQFQGYGKQAIHLLCSHLKKQQRYQKVILCYSHGNVTAKTFFESVGFKHTGKIIDDEIMMQRQL